MADRPVVLLQGARQTGKSTLARLADPAAEYLTLDDADVLASATSDPDGFIRSRKGRLVLDEVQRAPDLFRAIKAEVDRDRRPGRFLLTGSANVMLVPRASESLAGRMEILTLFPLSQGEIAGTREGFIDTAFGTGPLSPGQTSPLAPRILAGGYPEVVTSLRPERRPAWFTAYLSAVLQRDIRDMAAIEDVTALPRLVALLASRTAGLLNYADLARSLAIPQTTIKRYFALLEASFLVHVLRPWSTNTGLRLTKTPKVHLNDTGLACHLIGVNADNFESPQTPHGALLENFIAAELIKQASWSRVQPALFHFRTHSGHEVDLVLEGRDGRLVGVEVKASRSVSPADFRGLATLKEAAGKRLHRGIVLYGGDNVLPFGDNFVAAPHSALWALLTR